MAASRELAAEAKAAGARASELEAELGDKDAALKGLVVDVRVNERGLARLPRTSVQYCEPERPCTLVIGPGHHRRRGRQARERVADRDERRREPEQQRRADPDQPSPSRCLPRSNEQRAGQSARQSGRLAGWVSGLLSDGVAPTRRAGATHLFWAHHDAAPALQDRAARSGAARVARSANNGSCRGDLWLCAPNQTG